jgi:hypothetical protein
VEQSSAQSKELVKMTPAELELLIDKIMEETHPSKKKRVLLWKSSNSINNFLEKLILQNNGSSSIDKSYNNRGRFRSKKEVIAKLDLKIMQSELNKKIDMLISNPSEKERIVVVNPAGTVDQKNIVSREDDYVELRDDTLVPDDF